MGVKLRLARHGAKKAPYYRIVAADIRAPRDGRYIDHVGIYDPTTEPATIRLRPERIRYWLSVGAKPSHTVNNIFNRYLGTAESLINELEVDANTSVWVQGPDNSPAAQSAIGAPTNKTTVELTVLRKEAHKALLEAQKAAAPPAPEPEATPAPAPVKAAEEAPAEEAVSAAEEAPAEEAPAEEAAAEEAAEEAPAEEAAEEAPAEEATEEEAPAEEEEKDE